jgi:hypothetical protein
MHVCKGKLAPRPHLEGAFVFSISPRPRRPYGGEAEVVIREAEPDAPWSKGKGVGVVSHCRHRGGFLYQGAMRFVSRRYRLSMS